MAKFVDQHKQRWQSWQKGQEIWSNLSINTSNSNSSTGVNIFWKSVKADKVDKKAKFFDQHTHLQFVNKGQHCLKVGKSRQSWIETAKKDKKADSICQPT